MTTLHYIAGRILLWIVLLGGGGLLLGYFMLAMPGQPHRGEMPPLSGAQQSLAGELRRHVEMLAGTIGERNTGQPGTLERTADYIAGEFRAMGLSPRWLEYRADDDDSPFTGPFVNLEVEFHGGARADEVIVIGAHYDSAWPSPGADDNASGVAGLLEIARAFAAQYREGERFERSVRLVAFANEESPHFDTDSMGSKVYARRADRRGDNIVAMYSLEMLGYYDDTPGSQNLPRLLETFYPDRGNFIAFVANLHSRGRLRDTIGAFRRHADVPSYGVAAPQMLVPDIRRSDHAMFWPHGIPAIMITDTAGFRNPHYHRHSDQPDTLDYAIMARVVDGLARTFAELANPG